MREPQVCCACNRVERRTEETNPGFVREYWICVTPDGCGQEFARKSIQIEFLLAEGNLMPRTIEKLKAFIDKNGEHGR